MNDEYEALFNDSMIEAVNNANAKVKEQEQEHEYSKVWEIYSDLESKRDRAYQEQNYTSKSWNNDRAGYEFIQSIEDEEEEE